MKAKIKTKAGYRSVTPCITAQRADQVIEFLKKVFDAKEHVLVTRPDGKVAHADIRIGDSVVMIGEAEGDCKAAPATLYVYVKNADATYQRALKAGGVSISAPADMFWGDRHGAVKDRSGNTWGIATHIEDVSPRELKKRAAAFMAKQAARG